MLIFVKLAFRERYDSFALFLAEALESLNFARLDVRPVLPATGRRAGDQSGFSEASVFFLRINADWGNSLSCTALFDRSLWNEHM